MDPLTEYVVRNYEISQEIGRDGYCRYFRASSQASGGAVVLAMLRPVAVDAGFPPRFTSALERAAAVGGSRSLRILHAVHEAQGYYVVLEHWADRTLYDWVTAERLSPDEALSVTARLAEGLEELHRAGLVHGCLHPAAVFVQPPDLRLASLGIARAIDPVSMAAGSEAAEYLAPEQLQAYPVDGRCDLYALGLLLWFMLTGKVPAPAPGIEQPPPSYGEPRVDALLERLVQTQPRRRARSASQVRADIAALLQGRSLSAMAEQPVAPPTVLSFEQPTAERVGRADAMSLGMQAHDEGRYEEAVRLLHLAAGSAPKNARVLGYLGSALYRAGRYRQAAAAFARAAKIRPESGRLRYNLGSALLACGRREQALAAFRSAWELDPHCTAALLAIEQLEKAPTE